MQKPEAIERLTLLMSYSVQTGVYTSQAQRFILKKLTPEEQYQIVQEVMKAARPLAGPLFAEQQAGDGIREQMDELAAEVTK
jgi:hypothetical protein